MAVTVSFLIDKSKALADRRNDASIPDTDWFVWVNDSVESLYRKMVALDPALYFTTSDFTLTGSAAGAVFNLGSIAAPGFRAMHGLDLYPDTSNRRTIARRNFRERQSGVVGIWLPTIIATDRKYDIRQNSLVITPYEAAAGPYRLYYRQGPYKFTSAVDATTLDVQLEPYDEWIRLRTAETALGIEEGEQSPWQSRRAELNEEIAAACRRDDEPASIADVEDEQPSWNWPT